MNCQQQFTSNSPVNVETFFFLILVFTKNNFNVFLKIILQLSLSSLVCNYILHLNRISMTAFRYVRYSFFYLLPLKLVLSSSRYEFL